MCVLLFFSGQQYCWTQNVLSWRTNTEVAGHGGAKGLGCHMLLIPVRPLDSSSVIVLNSVFNAQHVCHLLLAQHHGLRKLEQMVGAVQLLWRQGLAQSSHRCAILFFTVFSQHLSGLDLGLSVLGLNICSVSLIWHMSADRQAVVC